MDRSPLRFIAAINLAFWASLAGAQDTGFKIVANASVGASSLTAAEASQIFLKRRTEWPTGETAAPVDQVGSSPVRRAFSKAVLKKDVDAVKNFWQTQIFSGKASPPVEKASDSAVLAFVGSTAGAVGYISSSTPLGQGVKEIRLSY